MLNMNKTKLYWILQILGWLGFALINLFLVSLERGISSVQIRAFLTLAGFYLISTHGLRYVIKKYGWFNLTFAQLILNTFLAL